MTVLDVKPLRFPALYDPDNDDTAILDSIDWDGASSFITGKFPSFQIQPKSNYSDYGVFNVKIKVRDDNPSMDTAKYFFKLTINPLPPSDFSFQISNNSRNAPPRVIKP